MRAGVFGDEVRHGKTGEYLPEGCDFKIRPNVLMGRVHL
jgi:hypothetical protein